MSAPLAVQRPSLESLAIPGALFSPCELAIGPSTSPVDYQRIGKAIAAIGEADRLWKCDYAAWGMRKYGREEGLRLAAEATGLTPFFLGQCARIAERFGPELRFPNFILDHYRVLLSFKREDIDPWLPIVAAQYHRLSAKALRALAVEKFGEPDSSKKPDKHSVFLRETTFHALAQYSPSRKVSDLLDSIVREWLARSESEKQTAIAGTSPNRRAENHRKAEQKRKCCAEAKGTASLDYQLKKFKREHPEWQGEDAVGARRNEGKSKASASPQPKSEQKKCTCRIDLCWSTCKGPDVPKRYRPDSFKTAEAASAAVAKYFACHAWHPFHAFCELCKRWHLYRDPQRTEEQS